MTSLLCSQCFKSGHATLLPAREENCVREVDFSVKSDLKVLKLPRENIAILWTFVHCVQLEKNSAYMNSRKDEFYTDARKKKLPFVKDWVFKLVT